MLVIDAPAPAQPGLGLLTAADGPFDLPEHGAFEGITYNLDTCGDVNLFPGACDLTPVTKDFDNGDGILEAEPFVVYASNVCGLAGASLAEQQGRLRRRFNAKVQNGVETAFWGADVNVPGYVNLASTTVDVLTASGDVREGISKLEQALADNYGMRGVIHARPRVAPYAGGSGQLKDGPPGNLAITWNENRVVFGRGYGGQAPDGEAAAAAGEEWMFITGRVITWRSDVFAPPARQTINRSTNQLYLIAEQTWVIAVECYIAATLVTLEGP